MQIKNLDARFTYTGEPELIITLPKGEKKAVEQLLNDYPLKPQWEVEIKPKKKNRSLNANAYFHLLVGKIAEAMNLGEEETKVRLVLEYGTVMRDENGEKVGFKLPVSVDVNNVYKYAKWFDEREENGHKFNCFIIYEHTHNLDTKDMARLIDGTVYEAKELKIETLSSEEIERMVSKWG